MSTNTASRRGGSFLRTCAIWTITIPLVLLMLALLVATVVIAAIGIGRATDSNVCLESNSTENCLPQETALSPIVDGVRSPQHRIAADANVNEYLYWMAGATACGILFAFVATFGLGCLEYAIYRVRKEPGDATDGEEPGMQLQPRGSSALEEPHEASPAHQPPVLKLDSVVKDIKHDIVVKQDVKLRKIVGKDGLGAMFMLFFGLAFFILGVMAMLWAIAIGYNHTRGAEREVYPFVVVELLVCVVFPTCLFISGILIAVVLHYVTRGALDGRQLLPRLLRNVKFEKGTDSDFWIIANSFYFTLKRREGDDDESKARSKNIGCGVCYSCFPNFATWIIAALAGLSIILAMSYFADRTIDTQVTVTNCSDTRINRDFSCFNSSTLAYVDCVFDTNVELMHCFRFYQFGVDVDLVSSLASAFAFYLVAVSSITSVFGVMQILLHLKNSKIWGAVFVASGFVALAVVFAVTIFWATGYIEATRSELSRLNIVNLAQLIMVCLFIILVGILIITSTWVEKVTPKNKTGTGGKATTSASASAAKDEKV